VTAIPPTKIAVPVVVTLPLLGAALLPAAWLLNARDGVKLGTSESTAMVQLTLAEKATVIVVSDVEPAIA